MIPEGPVTEADARALESERVAKHEEANDRNVLAVIVASLRLLETPCSTIEKMRLVNALCGPNYADEHAS